MIFCLMIHAFGLEYHFTSEGPTKKKRGNLLSIHSRASERACLDGYTARFAIDFGVAIPTEYTTRLL
jgi:hypothetical protein